MISLSAVTKRKQAMKLKSLVTLSTGFIYGCLSLFAIGQTHIPENASPSIPGPWACNIGYRPLGFSCIKFELPANAIYDPTGYGFWCDRGYKRNDQQCDSVVIPINGVLDTIGKGWLCARGYRKEDNSCLALNIPENAQIDFRGNSWACRAGFEKVSDKCIQTVKKGI
jgi:hypothetical protein